MIAKHVTSKAVDSYQVTSKPVTLWAVDKFALLREPSAHMFIAKTEAELRTTISVALKRYRALKGFSQEDLAMRAGVNRTFVSQIEREQKNVSIDSLRRLANALECDVHNLLGSSQSLPHEEED